MSSILGAITGSSSANAATDAAATQAAAADRATQLQQQMYEQTRDDLKPWTQAGGQATNGMMNLLGLGTGSSKEALQQDPSYQFRLQSGLDGVQSGAAAQGGLLSGATQKALNNYAQNSASQEYGNAFNRLQSVSSLGQNAAAQVGNSGANAAQSMGNNMMQGANATANGIINSNSAQTSGITNLLGSAAGIAGLFI